MRGASVPGTAVRAMLQLELIVQPSVDPALGPAVDGWLMNAIARAARRRAALRVYGMPGEVVSLGRYHLAPPDRLSAPALARRHAGGRAWPHGEGFVGVSLVLPHRSALVSEDPFALAPQQVPNRCVRAVLEGCRLAGIDAFYPGRDLITAGGRVLGALAFEVDGRGALLFEAVLCLERSFASLTKLLDTADPGGEVVARVWSEEETTSLAREGRTNIAVEDVADLLGTAFEEKFHVVVQPVSLADDDWQEIRALADAEYGAERWLRGRRRRAGLDRRLTAAVQLGALEALLTLGSRGEIEDIAFAGDFIANSPAIESLERRLLSRVLQRSSIEPVVEEVFADRSNFILGIGKASAITDLLLRGGEG